MRNIYSTCTKANSTCRLKTSTLTPPKGFTTIELVVVIAILAILTSFALPRFLDLGTEARTNAVLAAAAELDAAARQVQIKAMMPGSQINVASQTALDLNKNGTFDATDILLINQNVDNNNVHKIVSLTGNLILQEGPSNNQVHIGYDRLGNGDIRGGNCRVYFRQANSNEDFVFISSRVDGC